jgi:hypothetical protein
MALLAKCVSFVPRFLSTTAIVAIVAATPGLIPHNLLKGLIWLVFSAYRSGCHMSFLSTTCTVTHAIVTPV